ncbi:MAG: diguanylate cyclase [Gemmatimonadota bacterium]|nr:diguanylate cyclase [Gemmatimonadota bacterium]MDE3126777.1 diguanylate cyclase [Gemmatimonadota bacterium]MDE3216589.1 diguanylate cyclase [Gemmatimonadota bacterium]
MGLPHTHDPSGPPVSGRTPLPSTRSPRAEQHSLHSLRSKVTLALLLTGLVSAAVVGLVARAIVLGQFGAERRPGLAQAAAVAAAADPYVAAMERAMLYGVATAAALALVLGFFFGERLSRNLRALTDAIGAMGKGELRQRVHVRSRDEVGLMAAVFNRMSAELSESHARIRAQSALLKELSIHDDLTGLHNRRHFDQEAAGAFARARRYGHPLTVMIADVDNFKRVNDTYSHAVGDAVLAELARALRNGVRETDIVARYGGEEFVVVFPQTSVAQAAALCERVREQIASYDWAQLQSGLHVTLSMGLDGDLSRPSVDAMLAAADARMYQAKQTGRNRVVAGTADEEHARSA